MDRILKWIAVAVLVIVIVLLFFGFRQVQARDAVVIRFAQMQSGLEDLTDTVGRMSFDGGTLQATGAAGDFIKGFNDFAIGTGGLTVDTAEEGYALGVVNTKFKITPSATPAITLARSL